MKGGICQRIIRAEIHQHTINLQIISSEPTIHQKNQHTITQAVSTPSQSRRTTTFQHHKPQHLSIRNQTDRPHPYSFTTSQIPNHNPIHRPHPYSFTTSKSQITTQFINSYRQIDSTNRNRKPQIRNSYPQQSTVPAPTISKY
jgi:hypothetical protein